MAFPWRRVYLVCGLVMAGSEVWKQLCLTFITGEGSYIWWYFPFQLCSIPMYLCLLLPWMTSPRLRRAMLTFLMDYGLLAGICTFLDTSGLQYTYAPLTVHSYLWHILMIGLGVFTGFTLLRSGRGTDLAGACGIFLAGCGIATVLNLALYPLGKINMFYISPHYIMAQIVFHDLALAWGNTVAIFAYILAILLGAAVLHLVWRIIMRYCLINKTG